MIENLQNQLYQLENKQAKCAKLCANIRIWRAKNRIWKTVLERQNMTDQTIFELYTDDNKSKYSSNPKDILKSAKKIMKLYTKWTSTAATTEFVCKISNRKKMSNEDFNLCEAEISLDAIIKSINSETSNKPPGNDGLTAEFYRDFSNELAPALLGVYDSWGKLDTMGVTYRRGIISAIRAISRSNYFRKTGGRPKWEAPK